MSGVGALAVPSRNPVDFDTSILHRLTSDHLHCGVHGLALTGYEQLEIGGVGSGPEPSGAIGADIITSYQRLGLRRCYNRCGGRKQFVRAGTLPVAACRARTNDYGQKHAVRVLLQC